MAKFVCQVCGYVYEGDAAPEFCPLCKAPASEVHKAGRRRNGLGGSARSRCCPGSF